MYHDAQHMVHDAKVGRHVTRGYEVGSGSGGDSQPLNCLSAVAAAQIALDTLYVTCEDVKLRRLPML
jgi:hypothetical protein